MKRSSTRKLRVEQLENRAMLSVTASVLNGDTLSVIGDSNPNTIRVVQDAAATAWTVFNGVTNLGTFSNIRNININPKVGPDAVTVLGTAAARVAHHQRRLGGRGRLGLRNARNTGKTGHRTDDRRKPDDHRRRRSRRRPVAFRDGPIGHRGVDRRERPALCCLDRPRRRKARFCPD